MESILEELRASIAADVARAAGMPAGCVRLHIPARGAAAACPLLDAADAGILAATLSADSFQPVLGVRPVSRVEAKHGWLLFTLSDTFYTAAVRRVQAGLPAPKDDAGRYALNRMMGMARAGGDDCPADAAVQRAWLLTLCAGRGGPALLRAETALLAMTRHVPVRERAALKNACGGVADAAARILYQFAAMPADMAAGRPRETRAGLHDHLK